MRFLVLEHHFAQDIEALREAAGDALELDVIHYDSLRAEALRVLPAEVASGLEAFARPELEAARRRYGAILREILEDRFSARPFDAVLLPSDTFFYVRAAPAVAHALGVPLLVAQKETTISEHSLREHAELVRRHAPPLADLMTVCSERHKRFWVRAGAAAERIVVTGQPRFDFYSRLRDAPTRAGGAPGREEQASAGKPSALFLSYAVDAYHPSEGGGEATWGELRRQTEEGLRELVRRGWRVLVKPHPQQPLDGSGGGMIELDPQADVRPLIAAADVVVGFQSTAMLEAMLAGRPVLYTAWDGAAQGLDDQLIPFHRWEREIAVVRRAADLPDAAVAARASTCPPDVLRRRREIAERYLGPLDGFAAERTVAALVQEADRWARGRGAPERRLRARLAQRRTPLRIGRRSRAWARSARRRAGAMLGR